jgi:hypothetical protein
VAEWSKALDLGSNPKGQGFKSLRGQIFSGFRLFLYLFCVFSHLFFTITILLTLMSFRSFKLDHRGPVEQSEFMPSCECVDAAATLKIALQSLKDRSSNQDAGGG